MLLEINHLEKVFRTRFSKRKRVPYKMLILRLIKTNLSPLWENQVQEKPPC